MSQNGGNAIGIQNSMSPILPINVSDMWKGVSDDEDDMQAQSNIISRFAGRSVELGLENDFLYVRLCQSVSRLEGIAEKCEPTGVFQRLEPGYSKLNGPPA